MHPHSFPGSLFPALLLTTIPPILCAPPTSPTIQEFALRAQIVPQPPIELIGDLLTLPTTSLTQTGKSILDILNGDAPPQRPTQFMHSVPSLDSPRCAQNTCCVWKHVADEMHDLFQGKSGRCTKWARYAMRLGYHDAGSWSMATPRSGGADGSIILAGDDELSRPEHRGLAEIAAKWREWYQRYTSLGYDISMADFIQMGANVAAVTCPFGPRTRTFVGRKDSAKPEPEGRMPEVGESAEKIVARFEDMTVTADGLVALLGAHSTSQQRFFNESRALDPQDGTPGVWDTGYYGQTLGTTRVPKRVLVFDSDIAIAEKETRTWNKYGSNAKAWANMYAKTYLRVSLLGVYNINDLTECTKVLPLRTMDYEMPDRPRIDRWLEGKIASAGERIAEGGSA